MTKFLLFLITFAIVAMASSTTNAGRIEFGGQQQLPISNIMLQEIDEKLEYGCVPGGSVCITNNCCAGNNCKPISGTAMGICRWCPPAGFPCGALDKCCRGLSCDGFFSGTCR
ncbi:hypothetical protein SOVF_166980 [Spinacia oleracea]|nr:hypothetical protein SOVF_166980 [Spinacia oleracea]